MSRIGMLGGGQLGRMTALAARSAGHEVHVLDPDPLCPARSVADLCLTVPFGDIDAVRTFASACDVVTLEREDIPVPSVAAACVGAEMYPGPEVLATIQNKFTQKQWLQSIGAPTPEFFVLPLNEATAKKVRFPAFIKSCRGGFDGRGVVRVESEAEWKDFEKRYAGVESYYEAEVTFEKEISVMVARSKTGECVVCEPALNHHSEHILDWSLLGSDLPARTVHAAKDLARTIAEELRIVGLLVVEMFVTHGGEVLVNELAPRPHNSYHGSERAFITGQFEQLVRVLTGVPFGSVEMIAPTAIANLLGDLWLGGEPAWQRALRSPTVKLHLYGKHEPREKRKMGHLSATAADPAEAVRLVLRARELAAHDFYQPNNITDAIQRSL